jgi:hypothetical protein
MTAPLAVAPAKTRSVPPLSTSTPVLVSPLLTVSVCPEPTASASFKVTTVPPPPSGAKRKVSAEISEPKLMK